MAKSRLAMYRDMAPKRSGSSDDQDSAPATLFPAGEGGSPPYTKIGPKAMSSHSDSNDSAIDMNENEPSPAPPANLGSNSGANCLQDDLFSALISTYQENRVFFAKDQLLEILTEDRVRKELGKYFEDSLTEETIAAHAKTICHGVSTENGRSDYNEMRKTRSFIKVFAILIMIEKTQSIIKILEENVDDSNLPLIKVPRPHGEKLFDLRLKTDPSNSLKCFQKKWNQLNIRNFEELQWATLPVEFTQPTDEREVQHDRLEEQRVLPFIKDSRVHKAHSSRRAELEGGFASVFQVAIHPQHHNFHASRDQRGPSRGFFAVKGLHSQSEPAFNREVEMLKKFSNKHEHLISLLATYEQFGRFFLIFDWAEADLQRYWREINHSPSFNYATVLWLATQCKGIASGIIKIHQHESMYDKSDRLVNDNVVFGNHGDVKPENVLWFAEPGRDNSSARGTLKLSDFGLAELSLHQTISMAPKSKWGVSLGYRAPEADLDQGGAFGRSYDIWTLGCLYLEFITWILGGSKLLDVFSEARKARDAMWHDIETHTFFKLEIDSATGEKIAIIKPAVKQFIRDLHSHPKSSQFIHDFLDMVENRLLVVKTNNRQHIDRISIKQVYQELSTMLENCKSDYYAVSPVSL